MTRTEDEIKAEIERMKRERSALRDHHGWWVKDDKFKLLWGIAALEWVLNPDKPKEPSDDRTAL